MSTRERKEKKKTRAKTPSIRLRRRVDAPFRRHQSYAPPPPRVYTREKRGAQRVKRERERAKRGRAAGVGSVFQSARLHMHDEVHGARTRQRILYAPGPGQNREGIIKGRTRASGGEEKKKTEENRACGLDEDARCA